MSFKVVAFSLMSRVKWSNTETFDYSAKSYGYFYTSPCLFFVFENFRIRFILHTKMKVFLINVCVT